MALNTFLYTILLLCLSILSVHSEPEVITLQNGQNITCFVPESSRTRIFYLDPPTASVTTYGNHEPLPNNVEWQNDWKPGIASKSFQGPVMDKRWEDFGMLNRQMFEFKNKPTSASFSAFSSSIIKIFVENANDGSAERFQAEKKYVNKWVHYSIVSRNNKVFIFENGFIAKEFNNIVAERIVVRGDKNTFWKIHDYKFKYATDISSQPTVLKIPPSEKTCLIIYSSLCKECSLEITHNEHFEIKSGLPSPAFNEDNIYDSWSSLRIPLKPHESNDIIINRKSSRDGVKGLWAIDVRHCDDEKSFGITRFKTQTHSRHTCNLLKDIDVEENEIPTSTSYQKEPNCSPGLIGNNCKIRCSDILGSSYPKCEKNRICVNSKCTCAWGYQGEFCQESKQQEATAIKRQPDEKCNPHVRSCEESSPPIRDSSTSSANSNYPIVLLTLASLVMFVRHTTRSCTGFGQAI